MSRTYEFQKATLLADGKVMMMDYTKTSVEVYSYPPGITSHPASVAINQGRRVIFSVTASGGNLTYQWQKNTVDIPNEHGTTLTLNDVQAASEGSFRVVVSNTTGSVTSTPATLTVYPHADGDGLGDYQEVFSHFTNPNKKDTDEDGFLDGYEIQTGKSPLDPLDKPALVAEARTAIEFTFPSAIGTTYRIEDSPDLITWTTLESGISGNGCMIQRFYSTRNGPMRYFRVEVDAAP